MLIIFWFKRGTAMPTSYIGGPEKTLNNIRNYLIFNNFTLNAVLEGRK